jgi:hypothetical protein
VQTYYLPRHNVGSNRHRAGCRVGAEYGPDQEIALLVLGLAFVDHDSE